MQELNGSQARLPEQDFNEVFRQAQVTGNFDVVIQTAKKSYQMLVDFKNAVSHASFSGKETATIAMGLNFLENLIANSASQLNGLKQAEKQTREALKAASKEQDPEKPGEPADAPQTPAEAA